MTKVSMFHNPRCSKSRQTMAILEERGVDIHVIDYLNSPPNMEFLEEVLAKLNVEPLDIIRTKETLFKELGLTKKDERTREEWLEILVKHPKLIERPIVIRGGRAVIGRPPENALTLLNNA